MKLNLSDNALKVLEARYLLKNKKGEIIETPEELFRRVAICIANAEYNYLNLKPLIEENTEIHNKVKKIEDNFYELMISGKFLPNSPTLMNAGKKEGMLSGCFVLPVEDSVDSIFTAIKQTAIIQKAGGGTGFNFSKLRPEGDIVKTSGGTTSGPIPFIKVFSETTTAIQQGALRRGANMGIISIEHPNIIDFINIKDDLTQLTNFNLSVGITDKFIKEYLTIPNTAHFVANPRTNISKPLLINKKPISVQELFNFIIEKAWKTGEPGLVFLDRINKNNPTPIIGKITGTNPCGEQPLLDYEACTLGSINVSKFSTGPFTTIIDESNEHLAFNWKKLKETIELAVRFLDNTIDVNYYPLPEIEVICKGNRKIGLGIMGFADLLFKLGIPYNSKEALEFADELASFFTTEAYKASWELAKEKGCFPNCNTSIYYGPLLNGKIRNASVTTIAPTGSISIIADCSGGIEPLFSLVYERNILNGKKMIEINPIFEKELEKYCNQAGLNDSYYKEQSKQLLLNQILKEGTIQNNKHILKELKNVFVCSHDIEPEYHLKIQEVFQKYIDAGISKTINFKHNTSIEEVKDIFVKSLTSNIKGMTIYRDGCRAEQPMSLKNKEEEHVRKIPLCKTCGNVKETFDRGPLCNCKNKKLINPVTLKTRTFRFNDKDLIIESTGAGFFKVKKLYIKCPGCNAQIIAAKEYSFSCDNCNYKFIYIGLKNKKEENKCESSLNFGIDCQLEDICGNCNKELFNKCSDEYNRLSSKKEEINNKAEIIYKLQPETKEVLEKVYNDNNKKILKPEKLPNILPCIRVKQITPFGTMHVKICYNYKTNIEKEIFAQLGKGGDIANSDLEAICRLISLHLRCGGSIKHIEKQLKGIGSTLTIPTKEGTITSLADGLARAIKKYLNYKNESWIEDNTFKPDVLIKKEEEFKKNKKEQEIILQKQTIEEIDKFLKESTNNNLYKLKCPDCSETLIKSEGCNECLNCGYSQCG